MLKANLSTRPFYNERAVHLLIGLAAVLVLGFTAFNVGRILSLSGERTDVATLADDAEAQARQLRDAAARTRGSLDAARIAAASAAAREANEIIDRRLFSWTELLNYFETTQPDDVRLTAIRPRTNVDGSTVIVVSVVARQVEDVDAFMTALEETGAFHDVLSRDERTNEEGLLVAGLEARYEPRPATAAPAAGAAIRPPDDLAGPDAEPEGRAGAAPDADDAERRP